MIERRMPFEAFGIMKQRIKLFPAAAIQRIYLGDLIKDDDRFSLIIGTFMDCRCFLNLFRLLFTIGRYLLMFLLAHHRSTSFQGISDVLFQLYHPFYPPPNLLSTLSAAAATQRRCTLFRVLLRQRDAAFANWRE